MNVFVLSKDPCEAAQMQCDKHVVKMVTETAQILSSSLHLNGESIEGVYRPTHLHHPCVWWAGACAANFDWLLFHGLALADEYAFRYGRTHASRAVLSRIAESFVLLGVHALEPDSVRWDTCPQCMPAGWRHPDVVYAYRTCYVKEKARFAKWNRGRPAPDWWASWRPV